MIERFS
jgi:hypothetical protein